MSKHKNNQTSTATQTPKQNTQKQEKNVTLQNKPQVTNSKNELVNLLDFYRKAGYDYVNLIRADGSFVTVFLNDTATLCVKTTLGVSDESSSFSYEIPYDRPANVSLRERCVIVDAKEISGNSFTDHIHHVVNTANDYLTKKINDPYLCSRRKIEKIEFKVSDALDYLDVALTTRENKTGLQIEITKATRIVYQSANYIVFQNIGSLHEEWETKREWIEKFQTSRDIERMNRKFTPFHGADCSVRTDEFITVVPFKERMKIIDKEILSWATAKQKK